MLLCIRALKFLMPEDKVCTGQVKGLAFKKVTSHSQNSCTIQMYTGKSLLCILGRDCLYTGKFKHSVPIRTDGSSEFPYPDVFYERGVNFTIFIIT